MPNHLFTYRIRPMLLWILGFEIVFWIIAGLYLFLNGFLDHTASEQIGFRFPMYLWLHLAAVPFGALFFLSLLRTNGVANRVGMAIRDQVLSPVNQAQSLWYFLLMRTALAMLVFALSQPFLGTKKVNATMQSMELAICLDVSNSMNACDIDPKTSRLEIAKRALNQLINSLHGEKIGVVVFAGGSFVQLPLTSDYGAAKLFVNEIETDMLSGQGTNVASALEACKDVFTEQKTSKAIMLVTDGENHEANPGKLLKELQQKGIQLAILGIGTQQGGRIPLDPDRPELGNKLGMNGKPVTTKVNPSFIRSMANKARGFATISQDPFPDLSALLTQINQMKRSKVKEIELEALDNRYQFPLFVAVICFTLAMLKPWSFKKQHWS
jgi:Ca-activated chloride channel family protein